MLGNDGGSGSDAELELAIERQVAHRTGGRVRRLRVARADGRLVIRGCAASYYVKQLVIQAVLETVGAKSPPVTLEVEVTPSLSRPAPQPEPYAPFAWGKPVPAAELAGAEWLRERS